MLASQLNALKIMINSIHFPFSEEEQMMNYFLKYPLFALFLTVAFSAQAETYQSVIETEIDINMPIEAVFDYATTADNWSKWHPNTFSTTGADDHSATENEEIVETLRIGFLIGPRLFWTVSKHIEPNEWQLTGKDPFGFLNFDLTYTLSMNEDGSTHFHRKMAYELTNLTIFTLFDSLIFKPYNKYISERALKQLKDTIEEQ